MSEKIVVLGSINMDLVIRTPRHPNIGETIKGNHFQMIPGGKGANQAVAIGRQGVSPMFIGCVGNDGFGKELFELLKKERIDTTNIRILEEESTGVASIQVDDQSRNTIVISPGANEKISPKQIDQASKAIERGDFLICQLETNFDAVQQAIHIAHRHNTKIILNPAPFRDLPGELMQKIDFLIPNEIEASMLTGFEIKDLKTAESSAKHLLNRGVKNVLLTMGRQGVVVAESDQAFHEPAYTVQPLDTTAAGDTFVGAFAVNLLKGLCLRESVKRAQAAAAISVTRLGAQPSIPSAEEIDSFMNCHPQN